MSASHGAKSTTGFVDANVMLRAAHIHWVDAFLHNAVSSFDAFLHPLVLSILIYLAESIWLQAQNCLGCTSPWLSGLRLCVACNYTLLWHLTVLHCC